MTVSLLYEGEGSSRTAPGKKGLEAPLTGVVIGVTAGPTRAWIDPVRYLANASTGALGALIAEHLATLGATVTTILGPGALLPTHPSIRLLHIETPADLLATLQQLALTQEGVRFSYWIHAMAVLDYVPAVTNTRKISSDLGEWSLALKPAPKVIRHLKGLFPHAGLIGFKLASCTDPEELRWAAMQLADLAHCDLVVANPPPFDDPSIHKAWFWERQSSSWTGPIQGKPEIAQAISAWICRHPPTGHRSRA